MFDNFFPRPDIPSRETRLLVLVSQSFFFYNQIDIPNMKLIIKVMNIEIYFSI